MTILQLIAEWKKGCSGASPERPELCPQCTRGLIDAIERKAIAEECLPPTSKEMNHVDRQRLIMMGITGDLC